MFLHIITTKNVTAKENIQKNIRAKHVLSERKTGSMSSYFETMYVQTLKKMKGYKVVQKRPLPS